MPSIPLGPFQLTHPIGKGGMGEVWQGHHTDQDVPIAVKVMTAKVFEKTENRTRFNNEVRAVASLDHPGIVWVYDYGVVSAEASDASGGRLVAGSPYLAMEHASGGTLADLRRPLHWNDQRTVLLHLLDALAHAHAHGIVHRDLKPANVLISNSRDVRPGVKLTDFGIARAEAIEPTNREEVVGTLHYMAPEQIRADAWHQGPHTDLYGLGCLAWRLACGAVPFTGRKGVKLLAAQLHQELPALRPSRPVPKGLQEWLAALTAKDPAHRFRRAADAAHALLALPGPTTTTVASSSPAPSKAEDTLLPLDTQMLEDQATVLALPRVHAPPADPKEHTLARLRPALPDDWRRPAPTRGSIRLAGAGLGLFGVRSLPMVGRHRERDELWTALRHVHVERRAQLVVIRGAAGTGKSRLAEWLTRRAHEVGSATVAKARFQDSGASTAPLRRMFRQCLRLSPEEPIDAAIVAGWMRFWATRSDAVSDALHTLLSLQDDGLDRTTRRTLQRLLIEQMAHERPVILWLDDVQWGVDGLQLAQSILEAQALRPTPLLIVMTVREEALVHREQERALLEHLTGQPRTHTLVLVPLDRVERARLVQEMLGLEPSLGAAVEERSGGNPLFAVQLVGDWVQRGLLHPGESGFELATGDKIPLPNDLTEVWAERIERLLQGYPHDARWILERAAVIGPSVSAKEWRRVCDGEEIIPRHEVIRRALRERLLESRLANEADGGWAFSHGLLQETLLDGARTAGRWADHNRAAADMLAGDPRGATAERVGLHLLEAGDIEAAVEPLLRGTEHRRITVGRRSALRLIRRCEAAMTATVPREDRRWGALLLEKSTILDLLGLPEGQLLARDLLERARRRGWVELEGRAAVRLGRRARMTGDLDAAESFHLLALERSRAPALRAEASYELGRIAHTRGQTDAARAHEAKAITLLRTLDDVSSRTHAHLYQAEAAWHVGDWDTCANQAREGLDVAIDLGVRSRMWNLVAEAARGQGDFATAVEALDEAIAIADLIGRGTSAPVLRANLTLVHLAVGDFVRADQAAQDALHIASTVDLPPLLSILHALRMATAAGLGNWGVYDTHARRAESLQLSLPTGDHDGATALERAAELAEEAGHRQRARRAWSLAADHWNKRGDLTAGRRAARRAVHP